MDVSDFRQLYLAELEELRSVEVQMADHLGDLADRATDATLSEAIADHRRQTVHHRGRIDGLLNGHGVAPDLHDDAAMHGIIAEAGRWADMIAHERLKDAGLVASLQRMEHYEIAVLGTLASWARGLGLAEDAAVLSEILEQDRGADVRFSEIAEQVVNPAAL